LNNYNYFRFQQLRRIRENAEKQHHCYTFYVTYYYTTELARYTARSHTRKPDKPMQSEDNERCSYMTHRSTDNAWVSDTTCDMGNAQDACMEQDSVRYEVPWPLTKRWRDRSTRGSKLDATSENVKWLQCQSIYCAVRKVKPRQRSVASSMCCV